MILTQLFWGIGLVLVIEGLAYVLAPHAVERMLIALQSTPPQTRRMIGAVIALIGAMILYLIRIVT